MTHCPMQRQGFLVMGSWVLVTLAGLGHGPVLRGVGSYLVTEDPLELAAAIVVLNGHLPFRAMEAATLYQAGWAPKIAVVRDCFWPEDRALKALGVDPPKEWELNRKVLLRSGVPDSDIRVLDGTGRLQTVSRQTNPGIDP